MNDEQARAQHFYKMGILCGYPMCCVGAFVCRSTLVMTDRLTPDLDYTLAKSFAPYDNSGFLPCPACLEQRTPQQMIDIINKNRLLEHPFTLQEQP